MTGYIVRRNGVQVATPTTTILADTGLAAGQTYSYTVAARDAAGNVSPFTASLNVTTAAAPPLDTVSPTMPANLAASPGINAVSLSWNASTDNVGVTGYIVRRNNAVVATVAPTSYVDNGLTTSTTYSYTVSAIDAAGNTSPQTAAVSATTQGPPSPPPPVPPPLAGTALGNLAASMAPGTWAQLNVSNQNALLGVGNVSGTMVGYDNSMPWNPFTKVVEIVGMDHNYTSVRHVRYDVATNQFVLVADDAGLGTGTQHGYDHNTVNPYTGDLYHRKFSGFTGTIRSFRKALGAGSFAALPNVSANDQVAIGACWWSGPFVGGGAQGSFMIFNSGNAVGGANDGQILAYNPLTNTWFYNQEGKAPNYGSGATYHSVIEYSAIKNVAVYGGGNVAGNRLWRISSDGSVLAMPNVPAGKSVGVQRGLFVDEPVTGNFLLLSAGELWELNPSGSGTWTQQTGSRVPPNAVGVPGTEFGTVASIPDYGVVVFITQPSQTGGNFFVYKHQ